MTALAVATAFATHVASGRADEAVPPATVLVVEKKVQGKTVKWWSKRAVQARKDANARARTIRQLRRTLQSREPSPPAVIDMVFGAYGAAARAVAWCESKWYPWASNGQYQGMFQMGSSERAKYGHGGVYQQVVAAYNYFVESGRDWSPWECKP